MKERLFDHPLAVLALALLFLSLWMPLAGAPNAEALAQPVPLSVAVPGPLWHSAALVLLVLGAVAALFPGARRAAAITVLIAVLAGALCTALLAPARGLLPPAAGFWTMLAGEALLAAVTVRVWAERDGRLEAFVPVLLFGFWTLYVWQVLVTAWAVPRVLLPTPWQIGQALAAGTGTLAEDFVQTVLKAVLAGWVFGSAGGFLVGIAIDRVPFLQRGLLPLAALTSAVPLVAVAPIAVMWFGFDWPSKAAVVVLMTFFPMLIATLAGLQSAGRQELELMHSYAAGYLRTLIDLRLPAATPFLFGALKVNAALALIGAIVAEFFGSPTVGLGFRISTEAAHMNMSLVWAAIVVAAATGSISYALLTQLERRMAFWHPSVRP